MFHLHWGNKPYWWKSRVLDIKWCCIEYTLPWDGELVDIITWWCNKYHHIMLYLVHLAMSGRRTHYVVSGVLNFCTEWCLFVATSLVVESFSLVVNDCCVVFLELSEELEFSVDAKLTVDVVSCVELLHGIDVISFVKPMVNTRKSVFALCVELPTAQLYTQ